MAGAGEFWPPSARPGPIAALLARPARPASLGTSLAFLILLLAELALPAAAPSQERSVSTNEFLPESPRLWTQGIELRTAAGYKDNLLLSHHRPEHSALFANAVDWTVGRLPLDGREFLLLVSAEDTRYPDGRQVDHEDLVFAAAQLKLQLGGQWRVGLDARYIYQDQVVDTSFTETNLAATVVRGHGVALLPNVRWSAPGNLWAELSGTAQRQYYQEPLDDYWEGGPKLALGWDYGNRSSLALAYSWNWRAHDTREQVAVGGTNLPLSITNLPGTSLKFAQQDLTLTWRHHWDPQRHWRSSVRIGVYLNEDNGPGYYDYRRYLAAPQLRYVAARWELKAEARLAYYEFDRQPVSQFDRSLRRRTTLTCSLRGERNIGGKFKLFAEYEYEQSLSNRPTDEYGANRAAAGLGWEF